MRNLNRRLLIGLGAAIGGGVTVFCIQNRQHGNRVFASWTSNYTPSSQWDNNWDHRSPSSLVHPKKLENGKGDHLLNDALESTKPTATRHIILVRHGQYNLDGKNDTERLLTKLGREQAQLTGKRLHVLGFPISLLVRSTMTRAQETGDLIGENFPHVSVENCDLLREGAPIPPDPPIGSWKPEIYFYQDGARIEAAFRRYFHRADASQEQDSYTVLVCHANVIRYFVCRALQFPPEAWLRLSLNHASLTWITITPSGRCILRSMGDSGHMPPEMVTSR